MLALEVYLTETTHCVHVKFYDILQRWVRYHKWNSPQKFAKYPQLVVVDQKKKTQTKQLLNLYRKKIPNHKTEKVLDAEIQILLAGN